MSARDKAAMKYAKKKYAYDDADAGWIEDGADDFKAGWDAALSEPTDAEISELWRLAYDPENRILGTAASERYRRALTAFLTARKGKTQ